MQQADTIGTGSLWWLSVASFGLFVFIRQTKLGVCKENAYVPFPPDESGGYAQETLTAL